MRGWQHTYTLLITLLAIAALAWHGPIPQWPDYHAFADRRSGYGIANVADVLSNLPFALVALYGALRLWPRRHAAALQAGWNGHALFLVALLLTAVGSSYYHLAPDDSRLLWDRLPIALACAGLLAGVHAQACASRQLIELSVLAVLSVLWWHCTGDLRPYVALQLAPLVLIPLWQWYAPRRDRLAYAAAIALYVLAKVAELADQAILNASAIVSGHTLKHLLAASAALMIVQCLIGRTATRAGA
ncbi:hypothetical protein [Chitinolyticbacter albus]|uniref:hypothetical protein n=1 Tax=Chitinolyticbacter albus TaxID=2961951 RepID=UPI00210BBE34|nr:hypothetical protein [Chitinolyticbacter albus]